MVLFLCRSGWGLWWFNGKAAGSQPAADIRSAARYVWGNTPEGRHPRVSGRSGTNQTQERGVVMGHCHRRVCVHGRLQHWQIISSMLWPGTTCLPLRHTGLGSGNSHKHVSTKGWESCAKMQANRCGVNDPLLDVLSCLFADCFVREVRRPDAAGDVQTNKREKRGAGSQTLASQQHQVW